MQNTISQKKYFFGGKKISSSVFIADARMGV
jgi:hypothetical protein